jgi:2-oxoisovalerate dehydrogenase E2 component (dihydrolipoyl transacylase)
VVPVVQSAAGSTLLELAQQLDGVVKRARSGTMTLNDVHGGTFTLNNTGALGSVWGGAIINHPQAAILTTEAIVKRPVVISREGDDSVIVRSMMNICLSFDHRIIDGAEASTFLQAVKTGLEAVDLDTEF